MRNAPSNIDDDRLRSFLADRYRLSISSLNPGPAGEESFSYVAATVNRGPCFVRLQRRHWQPQSVTSFANSLMAAMVLREKALLPQVVAPYPTRQARAVCGFAGYTVAIFPLIQGRTLFNTRLSIRDVAEVARLLARLHSVNPKSGFPRLLKEQFKDPFRANILRVLRDTRLCRRINKIDPSHRRALHLLNDHRETILEAQRIMARLRSQIRKVRPKLVLTHGDANLANFIKDKQDRLYLTDWGDAGLGPAERDLFHFSGNQLGTFLKHYTRIRKDVEVSTPTFAFYYYRWALQEISDYSTRTFYLNGTVAEKRHSWEELKRWVPVPHDSISQDIARIQSILSKSRLTL